MTDLRRPRPGGGRRCSFPARCCVFALISCSCLLRCSIPRSTPSWTSAHRPERLAGAPAVRCKGRWWLLSPAGTMLASDPVFNAELDFFAADMAAANCAVVELHAPRTTASDPARKARR